MAAMTDWTTGTPVYVHPHLNDDVDCTYVRHLFEIKSEYDHTTSCRDAQFAGAEGDCCGRGLNAIVWSQVMSADIPPLIDQFQIDSIIEVSLY